MADRLTIFIDLQPRLDNKVKEQISSESEKAGKKSGDRFEKGFKTGVSSLSTAGTQLGTSFGAGFSKSINASFAGLQGRITNLIAGFASFAVLKDATSRAREFGTALAEIRTILPQTQKLTSENVESLREFAGQFGSTGTRQAKAFYQVISAGVTDTAKATQLLNVANKLAVAGVTDVGNAINILTTVINAYGAENLTAKDAADSLFTAVRLGKTTVEELSSTLGLAIPAARSAGVSLDVVNSAIATLTAQGFETATAVTRVNGLLTALARNGAVLGKGFNIAAVQTDGLAKVLQRLEKRTNLQGDALLKLLGRQEAVQAVQTLARDGAAKFTETLEQFGAAAENATEKAFGVRSQTDAFKFEQSISKIGTQLERLGSQILPPVASALEGVTNFISKITFSDGLEKDVDTLDAINTELANTIDSLDGAREKLEDLKKSQEGGFSFANVFGRATNAQIAKQAEEVERLERKFNKLNETRKEFSKQNKNRSESQIENDKKEIESNNNKTNNELTNQQLLATARIQNERLITESFAQRIAAVNELRQRGFLTEQEQKLANDQLEIEREEQLQAFRDGITERRIENERSITGAVIQAARSQQSSYVALGKTLKDLAIRGFGNAFQSIGKALAQGQNANQAFVDSVRAAAGEAASALGDFYIKDGIGRLARQDPTGGAVIAAGAGLKVLAGALSAGGGSSVSSSSGGFAPSGSVSDPINTQNLATSEPIERAEAQGNITINIDRFVGEEEEAQRVAELLSDAGAKDGVLLTNVRGFA